MTSSTVRLALALAFLVTATPARADDKPKDAPAARRPPPLRPRSRKTTR